MKANYKLALTLLAGAALGVARKFLILALAPVVLMTGAMLSTPAAAIDTRTAIKMCDANPNCGYSSNGNVTLCTKGAGCVSCPAGGKTGDCIVAGRKAPKGGKGNVGTVGGILQGGNAPPKGKGPVVGGTKAPSGGVNSQPTSGGTNTIYRSGSGSGSGSSGGGGGKK
jgi:uncharacterized membrane protein YgcG